VTWVHGDGITFLVAATMVFTGMTLTLDDFTEVLLSPSQVSMGCLCQFSLMPLIAAVLSRLLKLPPDIAAGMILLGSAPAPPPPQQPRRAAHATRWTHPAALDPTAGGEELSKQVIDLELMRPGPPQVLPRRNLVEPHHAHRARRRGALRPPPPPPSY
jgi:hypothetical protein